MLISLVLRYYRELRMLCLKERTCCFTGHREIPSGAYQHIFNKTEEMVESLIKKGYLFFGAGGALGFDTIAAFTVLKLKERYPDICLILVLPCRNQTTCLYFGRIHERVYAQTQSSSCRKQFGLHSISY